MSIKKNKNQLIISILVGIAIFAITYQFVIQQHQENLRQREEIENLKKGIGINPAVDENSTIYVVAKKKILKNHIISAEDVELKDLETTITNTYKDVKFVIGTKAAKDIEEGRPVLKTAITIISAADEPKPGFRAVSVIMPLTRMAPFVEDGAYIDIYTAENTIQAANVRVIKVLDTGSKANKLVLFEVKEEDVPAFIFGATEDKIIPVQKNKDDKAAYSFAYDPFKYSSYTVSNEDMEAADLQMLDSAEQNTVPVNSYIPASNRKSAHTVEVIQGNKKEILDF